MGKLIHALAIGIVALYAVYTLATRWDEPLDQQDPPLNQAEDGRKEELLRETLRREVQSRGEQRREETREVLRREEVVKEEKSSGEQSREEKRAEELAREVLRRKEQRKEEQKKLVREVIARKIQRWKEQSRDELIKEVLRREEVAREEQRREDAQKEEQRTEEQRIEELTKEMLRREEVARELQRREVENRKEQEEQRAEIAREQSALLAQASDSPSASRIPSPQASATVYPLLSNVEAIQPAANRGDLKTGIVTQAVKRANPQPDHSCNPSTPLHPLQFVPRQITVETSTESPEASVPLQTQSYSPHVAFELRPLPTPLCDNQFTRKPPNRPFSNSQVIEPKIRQQPPVGLPTSPKHQRSIPSPRKEDVTSLRAKAQEAGDAMARCFTRAIAVHNSRDKNTLIENGYAHKREMQRLNEEAKELIIKESEARCDPGTIDLHRLQVKEAISHTSECVQTAVERGDSKIKIIVGKGNHSKDSVARLRPEIEEWLRGSGYVPKIHPSNGGMFIVSLNGIETMPQGRKSGRSCKQTGKQRKKLKHHKKEARKPRK